MTTIKQIKERFNTTDVEPVRGQSWIVNNRFFVSYSTIIGINSGGVWYVTRQKFSSTTSRHVSEFSKQVYNMELMDIDIFQDLLDAVMNHG